MDQNYYDEQMRQLQDRHASAKIRMISGIIVLALGITLWAIYCMSLLRISLHHSRMVLTIVFVLTSLLLIGGGVALLVTGIVGMTKANNRMELLKRQRFGPAPQQPFYPPYPPYQPPYQQPNYQQPDDRQNTNGNL